MVTNGCIIELVNLPWQVSKGSCAICPLQLELFQIFPLKKIFCTFNENIMARILTGNVMEILLTQFRLQNFHEI